MQASTHVPQWRQYSSSMLDAVLRKGLALFANLLVKTGPDHVEETIKLRALLHFLDKVCHLMNRKIDVAGEILLQLIERACGVSD